MNPMQMQLAEMARRARQGDRQAALQLEALVRRDPGLRGMTGGQDAPTVRGGMIVDPEAAENLDVFANQIGEAGPAPGSAMQRRDVSIMPNNPPPQAAPRDTTQLPMFALPETLRNVGRGMGENRYAAQALRAGMTAEEMAAQQMAEMSPAPRIATAVPMAPPAAGPGLTSNAARTMVGDYGDPAARFGQALAAVEQPGPEMAQLQQARPLPMQPAPMPQPPAAAMQQQPAALPSGLTPNAARTMVGDYSPAQPEMTANAARTMVGDYTAPDPASAGKQGGFLANLDDEMLRNLLTFGLATMAAGGQPGVTTAGAIGQGGLAAIQSAERRDERKELRELRSRSLGLQERGVANQEKATDLGHQARMKELDQRGVQLQEIMRHNRAQEGNQSRQTDLQASALRLRQWELDNPQYGITAAGDSFIAVNHRNPNDIKVLSGADGRPITKGVTDEKAMELALNAAKIGGSVTSEKRDPITQQVVGYQTTYDPERGNQAAAATLNALGKKELGGKFTETMRAQQGGSEEKPPVEGARKATDGKWYVPDPNRPGKFLMVQP